MDDLDRKIKEALSAEDMELYAGLGEQNIFAQWFSVYDGKMRWVAVYATILTFVLTIGAIYCGWRLFSTDIALDAARWGAGTVMLMVMVGFLKLWFWLRMEANRILREIKRVELQIARTAR